MSHDNYTVLAAKILSLFPNEVMGTYYVPAIKKSDTPLKKSIMSRGKLVNCVRNILQRSGDTKRRRTLSKTDEDKDNAVVPENFDGI